MPNRFAHLLTRTLAVAALLLASAALHADEMFLQFKNPISGAPTITGESTDSAFRDQISLLSFSIANATTVTQTSKGPSIGKPIIGEFSFVKQLDRSSPRMFEALVRGSQYGEVTMSQRRLGGTGGTTSETYLKIDFKNVIITSISTSSGGDGRPVEQVSFAYTSVRYTYTGFDQAGRPLAPVIAEYNTLTNRVEFRDAAESVSRPVLRGARPSSTGTEITIE